MFKKSIFNPLAVLLLASIILTACAAPTAAPTAEEAAPTAEEARTLVFIPGSASNPSQAFGWKMFQKHAAEYNFEVSTLDGKADVQEQTKAINNAVAQGADVIIVNPNDAKAVVPALKAAQEAGVVVGIFMAFALEPGDSTFYVTVDDNQAGNVAIEGILQLFPEGATGVEIGGQAGHPAAILRHDGFTTALESNPSIKVLDYQNPQAWDAAQAQTIAEDMITKYGDEIQYVFCHWDNGATGVINALNSAGLIDVLVIGVDGNKVAYEQVQTWKNYISIGQNVETIAMKSMEVANQFLDKDPAAKVENIVPFDLITKDTYMNFTAPEW